MDNTEKFSGKAEFYQKARPDYSVELIKYLINIFKIKKDTVIADIGSGTGKLSKEFLKLGCKVFCVEPNFDMRKTAEKNLSEYSGFVSVNGTDKHTCLEDKSIDIVTVAQAFHWFDPEKIKKECQRILKTKGTVVLVYNHRVADSDLVKENAEICKMYCPNFKGFSNKFNNDDVSKIENFFDNKYEVKSFPNNLAYNKDMFINRMMSASYLLTEQDKNYNKYIKALEQLFKKYQMNGILTMPNETIAYIGT